MRMQFSLRSLLISFAVAGTGAAVFCAWCFEPPPWMVAVVVVALLCSTLFGSVRGRKERGFTRVFVWLVPPTTTTISIVLLGRWQMQETRKTNENQAARACLNFANGEEAYHRTDWDHDGVLEYAPSLKELRMRLAASKSAETIEQGLADAEWPSTTPFHGYFFKVFKSQNIPIARSYFDKHGKMTQGYAVAAWPAQYGWTGKEQFIMSNAGTIYQADYGKDVEHRLDRVTEYSPDAPHWMDDDE